MKLLKPLVIIDLETTGTWVEKDKIIEVGMIKCLPDGSKEVFQKRVNPGMPIPNSISRLLGITNEDVKDLPHFKNIAQDVVDFIGNSDLGGFSIERFDLPVLQKEVYDAGLRFESMGRNIYDAQKIYHVNEKRDLTAAYQFYCGKKLINPHSALGDAEVTLEIIDAQVKKYGTGADLIEELRDFDYEPLAEYFDKDRKFRWWNKELYPMFGKYAKRYSVEKIARVDSSYLEWILTQDFSDEVKVLIEGVLAGRIPKYPGG